MEREGALARLIINRPPLNILDIATLRELKVHLDAARGQPGTRLWEIRGAGEKAFSAGTEVREHFPERVQEMLREFHTAVRAVLYAPVPTLAVVRGHCLGGGMELALACDFILASEDSRFGVPEIKVGCFPPVAAVLLPHLMPRRRALEMILTGETVSGEEAYRLGLVNRLAAPEKLAPEVEKFSSLLLAQSPEVMALGRKATALPFRESFDAHWRESERLYLEELRPTADMEEGLRAFLEKRPARWK